MITSLEEVRGLLEGAARRLPKGELRRASVEVGGSGKVPDECSGTRQGFRKCRQSATCGSELTRFSAIYRR